MKKIMLVMVIILLLNLSLVSAITQQEANEAKRLIDSKADCKNLSNSQLEIIGEYEMELMHPGTSHEAMHKMMGIKEGSDAEEQFHINMAKTIYCGEDGMGMMNMMMGDNMVGGGMMGNYPISNTFYNSWNIFWILSLIGLIVLIIWFTYKFLMKNEKNSETPINILKKRYAHGEITKKQFEEMKKEIGK